MLKGFEEKEYAYSQSDALEILNKLLKKGLVELLESNYPAKVQRPNDPRYCKYHRIISHPIE